MQRQWAKHMQAGGALPLHRLPPSSHCQEHSAGSRPGLGPASLAEMYHQIHRVRAPGHDDPQMALRRCASESHSFCEGVKSRLLTYASSGAFFPFLGTRYLHVPAMFTSQSSEVQLHTLKSTVGCPLLFFVHWAKQACFLACMRTTKSVSCQHCHHGLMPPCRLAAHSHKSCALPALVNMATWPTWLMHTCMTCHGILQIHCATSQCAAYSVSEECIWKNSNVQRQYLPYSSLKMLCFYSCLASAEPLFTMAQVLFKGVEVVCRVAAYHPCCKAN